MGRNGNGKRNWSSVDPVLLDPSGNAHRGISMPGYDGLPFRGDVPDLKNDDPEHKLPQIGQTAHVEILDLSIKDQLKHYEEVCQLVANGFAAISKEDMQWDPKKKNWRVFLRWIEYFMSIKKGGTNGRGL